MPVHQVRKDPLIRDSVDFSAALVTIVAPRVGRTDSDLKRCEQRRGSGCRPWLPVIGEFPRGQPAIGINSRLSLIDLGWTLRFPAVFVLTRPLNTHWGAGRTRK